ncbi:MAG: FAD-binding oxidoreductase [Opitutaceae bacterium]|nr:FAD-binding oxidoreductase [Opitutaceae bacterium]
MPTPIVIVGQGLAGTLLAWELERNGVDFAIIDAGSSWGKASAVATGIINPITGQRLVKSWRVDELLPLARAAYRELEAQLGLELWREMRVRRLFRDEAERRGFAGKQARSAPGGCTAIPCSPMKRPPDCTSTTRRRTKPPCGSGADRWPASLWKSRARWLHAVTCARTGCPCFWQRGHSSPLMQRRRCPLPVPMAQRALLGRERSATIAAFGMRRTTARRESAGACTRPLIRN